MNPENLTTKCARDFTLIKCYKNDNSFVAHRNIDYAIIENNTICIVFDDESCLVEHINEYERITIQ